MMTLHTMRDPVVPVFHEDLLAQAASMKRRRLRPRSHAP